MPYSVKYPWDLYRASCLLGMPFGRAGHGENGALVGILIIPLTSLVNQSPVGSNEGFHANVGQFVVQNIQI